MPALVGNRQLLAVDLGLQSGMAMYGPTGRLRWYRSQRFDSTPQLRRVASRLLGGAEGVDWLISEGDIRSAAVWERIAMRQGVRVQRVGAATWRDSLLLPDASSCEQTSARQAQVLARRVIAWSGGPPPAALQPDAAEAILIGLWGVMALGWLRHVPHEVGAPAYAVSRV